MTDLSSRAAYDAEQIARASFFTATLFRGSPAGFAIERADTLAEAEALARTMRRRYASSRLPAVYAVTPEGASIFVRGMTAAECGR